MSRSRIKKVVVFGANSALGSHLVGRLLELPEYEVFGTYRTEWKKLAALYEAAGLDPTRFLRQLDLQVWEDVAGFVKEIRDEGNLWATVNYVGEARPGLLTGRDADRVWGSIRANLLPALNSIRASAELLHDSGGRIVQISSVLTRCPVRGAAGYAAAKSAAESLVRTAAIELSQQGITVNCLRLGYFDAGMINDVPPAIIGSVLSRTATGTLGDPGNVTQAVEYILGPNSEFLTGATIDLDGGLY